MTAELVLVSTPIGNLGDLPPRASKAMQTAALICCEDTRRTGQLLSHLGISGVRMAVVNEHTEAARTDDVLALLAAGESVAVVTDAGTPGISDPGMRLVQAAIAHGHRVSAVPGPAAFVMALVISGFDTTRFVFEGFLPRSGQARGARLREIAPEQRTIVLYEAPHRVVRTVNDLATTCGGERRVALTRELTKLHEEVWRGTLTEAAEHLAAHEPRGEYVVVLQGAPAAADATDDDLRAALRMALAAGDDQRTAIGTVMGAHGASKRRVYDLALELRKGAPGGESAPSTPSTPSTP